MLLGEYGYHQIAHIFLIHALCINYGIQQEKACSLWLTMREFDHHMTSPMSMCFELCKTWYGTLMMCINGAYLYWDDMKFHMPMIMSLLHDAHGEERGQQDLLLLWLLLGEFGLSILHGGDGGW